MDAMPFTGFYERFPQPDPLGAVAGGQDGARGSQALAEMEVHGAHPMGKGTPVFIYM
jgi:hypothetical protein